MDEARFKNIRRTGKGRIRKVQEQHRDTLTLGEKWREYGQAKKTYDKYRRIYVKAVDDYSEANKDRKKPDLKAH